MSKENLKLFVGGYFDDRVFEGEYFEGKTPFSFEIDTYTLGEALKLGFVEGVSEYYNENRLYDEDPAFNELTFEEKAKAIEEYTETDEIAGMLYFETEEEAENYKQDVLKELEELEDEIEYSHKEQDREGFYREVYIRMPESREARLIVNKAGSGSITFRATLPQTWIRKMGLGEESRDLILNFDGEKIIIEKK